MGPFGLQFGRNEAKLFDQHVYMPPGSVLNNTLSNNLSDIFNYVSITGFFTLSLPVALPFFPYIGVFAEIGGLKLSFPGSCSPKWGPSVSQAGLRGPLAEPTNGQATEKVMVHKSGQAFYPKSYIR